MSLNMIQLSTSSRAILLCLFLSLSLSLASSLFLSPLLPLSFSLPCFLSLSLSLTPSLSPSLTLPFTHALSPLLSLSLSVSLPYSLSHSLAPSVSLPCSLCLSLPLNLSSYSLSLSLLLPTHSLFLSSLLNLSCCLPYLRYLPLSRTHSRIRSPVLTLTFFLSQHRRGCRALESAYRSQVRDSLLYSLRSAGSILEDYRKVGLSGPTLGSVHNYKRKLSVEDELNQMILPLCV